MPFTGVKAMGHRKGLTMLMMSISWQVRAAASASIPARRVMGAVRK